MEPSNTLTDAPTKGRVIRWARFYDTAVGIISLGREDSLRRQTLEHANLQPNERVLDVGCGTGTLVIAAAQAVQGLDIRGIDPASNMVVRARHKAAAAGVHAQFDVGVIERIEAPDETFDVVFSSLMLHHLPPSLQQSGLGEILRILRPGGRLVLVDFAGPGPLFHRLSGLLSGRRDHARHSHDHLGERLSEIGFERSRRDPLSPGYLFCIVAWKRR